MVGEAGTDAPTGTSEALRQVARGNRTIVAGGTDLMVARGRTAPTSSRLIDITRVPDWTGLTETEDHWIVGAARPVAQLETTDCALPGSLATAARTLGSPQIRNRATLGGNLATASPAADMVTVLHSLDAEVEASSVDGKRWMTVSDLCVGPKQTSLRPDQVLSRIRIPRTTGSHRFAKVGRRGAMNISIVSAALSVEANTGVARIAFGSVAPTVMRARKSEEWLTTRVDLRGGPPLTPNLLAGFADCIRSELSPIDDYRSTRDYRLHAAAVLAARLLQAACQDLSIGGHDG